MSLAMECQLKSKSIFEKNREVLFDEATCLNLDDPEGQFQIMMKQYCENMISDKAAEAFGVIVDMTNGLAPKDLAKHFLAGLNRQHRYLQGEFWNTIIHLMKLYSAQDKSYFDVRNENARMMCEEISKQW